jgi:Flp pilus assembly secretin CpaC
MQDTRISSRNSARWIFPTALLCGFAYCGWLASAASPAPEMVYQIGAATHRLEVRDLESVLIQFPEWLTRVRSSDASMVRVTAVGPDCLRVTRLAEGRTTLTAVDRQKREYSVELSLMTTRAQQ